MANVIGKNAAFYLSNEPTGAAVPTGADDAAYQAAAANNIQVETFSNEITLNIESNTDEVTAYLDNWEKHEVITGRWSADITAYFDTAAIAIEALFVEQFFEVIEAAPTIHTGKQRFGFFPNGIAAAPDASPTQPKYIGAVVIAQATIDPVRTGVARLRARLMGSSNLFRDITAI